MMFFDVVVGNISIIIQMGNQQNDTNIQKFRKQDWEAVQKLPEMQVWQNRKDPSYRIEQYQLYTQTDAQLRHQKKMFQLRRRSPLLVAALYFQLQLSQQFCASHSKHLLFLERIPIRLLDVEHVPYPDYLHLFDACLKGFGQLARCAGYFLVDEGMIGINEQGMAKAWLNQDFSNSRPFGGQNTQENMVRSLIDTIQRNIDSELLPNNVPNVRNFLYKGEDALTFDTAIFQLREYVQKFNNGKIPEKLDCIDRVGGIYTIANRQQINYNSNYLYKSQVPYKIQNGGVFSEVNAYGLHKNQQRLNKQTSSPEFQLQHSQVPLQQREIKHTQQYFRTLSKPVLPTVNRQLIQQNAVSPRATLNGIRQSNIIHKSPTINFPIPNQSNNVTSPRNSQQIFFQSPKQAKKIQMPISNPPPIILSPNQAVRSPPHATLPHPITKNYQQKIVPQPPIAIASIPPIQPRQQISPRISGSQLLTQSNHFTQKFVYNPIVIAPPQPMPQQVISRDPIPVPAPKKSPFSPQISKAPRFTVEVIPGKVYPQKSSTIFKKSNVSKQKNQLKEAPLTLEQHKAIITTSEKVVPEDKIKNDIPPEQKRQLIEVKLQQIQEVKQLKKLEKQPQKHKEIIQNQKATQKQKIPQKESFHLKILINGETYKQINNQVQQKIANLNLHNQKTEILQQHIQHDEQTNKNVVISQVQHSFVPKNEKFFDTIQRKVMVQTSYQGQYMPVQQSKHHQMPVIEQNLHVGSEQQIIRQGRMSLWTAGSQEKSIDYQQMQRNLAISFNHAYDDHNNVQYSQSSNNIQRFQENHVNYGINHRDNQQQIQSYQYNNNYGYKENKQHYTRQQLQFNSIKETGKFGYSQGSNGIHHAQINQNANQIYKNGKFQDYHANNYQNKLQYALYQSDYDQNGYNNFGEYDHFSSKVGKQNVELFKHSTKPVQVVSKIEVKHFQYQTIPKRNYSSVINQGDGKSSPDFLKRLNEMAMLDPQQPRMHHQNYQPQQTSNSYSEYLKNLTSQKQYSHPNNEVDYGNYTHTNHFGDYNQYSNSSEFFKGYAQKLDLYEN